MAFTNDEIAQIIEEFFKTVGARQYIGARYVPIFGRKDEESIEWDEGVGAYEPLTVVLYQGNSYTSRQFVPAGVDIDNEEFWANTGNYNAQVEQYRRDVAALSDAVGALGDMLPDDDFSSSNTVKKYIDDNVSGLQESISETSGAVSAISNALPASDFSSESTVKAYIDSAVGQLGAVLPTTDFTSLNTVKGYIDSENAKQYVQNFSSLYSYTEVVDNSHVVHIGVCDDYENYMELTSFTSYVNSEDLNVYPAAVTYIFEHDSRFFMMRGLNVVYSDDLIHWYVTPANSALVNPYGDYTVWACKVFKIENAYYFVGSYRYDGDTIPTRDGGTTYNFKTLWCEVTFDENNMPVFSTLAPFPYFSSGSESWIDCCLCKHSGKYFAAAKNEANATIVYMSGNSFSNMTQYSYQVAKSGVEAPCFLENKNGLYLTFEEYSGTTSQYTGFGKAPGHVLFGKTIFNSGNLYNPEMRTLRAPHPFVHIQFVPLTTAMLKAIKDNTLTKVLSSRFDRGFDSTIVSTAIKQDTTDHNYVLELTEGIKNACSGGSAPTHFTLEVHAPYCISTPMCGCFTNNATSNKYVTLTGDVPDNQKNTEFTLGAFEALLFIPYNGHNVFVYKVSPAVFAS